MLSILIPFFFSSRRRHTRLTCDWGSDVCSSDLTRRWQRDCALPSTRLGPPTGTPPSGVPPWTRSTPSTPSPGSPSSGNDPRGPRPCRITPGQAARASPSPQLPLHHLAARVPREFPYEFHRPRDLVVRHLAAGPGDEVVGGEDGTLPPYDIRLADLAQAVVRYADDRHVRDVGVEAEELFYLGGVGVEAADDEHVLDAVGDAEVAGRVQDAHVAGAQPAVRGEDAGGLLGVLEVAPHHVESAHQHLTRGARGRLHAYLHARDGPARGRRDHRR